MLRRIFAPSLRRLVLPALIAPLAGLAACASAPSAEGGAEQEGPQLTITVENDLSSIRQVTIWLVPDAGGRGRLGSVGPRRTETFKYTIPGGAGRFKLRAESAGGSNIESEVFSAAGGSTVRWLLQTNLLETR